MTPDLETLADRLERAGHAEHTLEGERLRRLVRARLLDETAPEPRIDRYIVTGRLGEGGMGVVYRAYDAELDRRLAIKLVRRGNDPERAGIERQRLLAEARALAQLSHPNVVAIYDVGLHAGAVFIAMELVQGVTLREHVLGGTRRGWREILRAYRQAGEGLAAVHAAGLVHRDFKPDNVLVGEDGRVRVADFGLARADDSMPTDASSTSASRRGPSLTATGKIVGTPAYMAPEQYAGRDADARTDQFSFCMSLWEALHRVRPFPADDTRAIAEGRILPAADEHRVPAWLCAVILRGLAPDPAHRWPSMQALLAACARDPTPRRRAMIAMGVLLVATGAAFVGGEIATTRAAAQCRARADRPDLSWNDDVRAEIATAFTAAVPAHGAATAARVSDTLAAWQAEGSAARERACMAQAVTHAIDEQARTRREACLDEHAERMGLLVDILRDADGTTVNNAVRAALELPPVSECEDDRRLAARATTDSTARHEIRRDLTRSVLLDVTGRRAQAEAAADTARRAASELGDAALEAEANLRLGRVHSGAGEYAQAATSFERAYFAAIEVGADDVALDAATQLVMVVGLRQARFDDGLAWSRHARGLLTRVSEGRDLRAARLEEQVANVLRMRGDRDEALASYERALELWTAHAGPDSPQVGDVLTNLGGLLTERGDLEDGERVLEHAERVTTAAFGDSALEVAGVVSSRCSNAFSREDFHTALIHCQRALALREARLSADHPSLATALSNLATAYTALERFDAARPLLERAIAIRRIRLGDTHPAVATSISNLGVLETNAGDFEAALKNHTEALEIRRRALPPAHIDLAVSLLNLSDVLVARGESRQARPHVDEALAIAIAARADAVTQRARDLLETCERPQDFAPPP